MSENVNAVSEVSEQDIMNFINHYQSLNESEKFKLGGLFNKMTGGKLSPYDSPNAVGVGMIQVQDGDEIKLLGVRRAIAPNIGEIALPGGFVNKLENGKQAAQREVLEETGLNTDLKDYKLFDDDISPRNVLLLFYLNKTVFPKEIMNTLVLNSEVSEFVLIDRETPLAFPLHTKMVNEFFELNKPKSKMKMK
jgi:ADP-ribose pyrophosphatase YjhB (NUDIX family)